MKRFTLSCLLFLLLFSLLPAAHAQTTKGVHFGMEMGGAFLLGDDGENFTNSFAWGGHLGYGFASGFLVGLQVLVNQNHRDKGDLSAFIDENLYLEEVSFNRLLFIPTLHYLLLFESGFFPYGGGGVGWYHQTTTLRGIASTQETDNMLGFMVEGGGGYFINRQTVLRLAVAYHTAIHANDDTGGNDFLHWLTPTFTLGYRF